MKKNILVASIISAGIIGSMIIPAIPASANSASSTDRYHQDNHYENRNNHSNRNGWGNNLNRYNQPDRYGFMNSMMTRMMGLGMQPGYNYNYYNYNSPTNNLPSTMSGTVVSVNGSKINIVDANNITRTIDASSAIIRSSNGSTYGVGNIAVGDVVYVQGTAVNYGNYNPIVTASLITDVSL